MIQPNSSNSGSPMLTRVINPDHLQQLMDMGFSHLHCREALSYTASVELATEYLLVHANQPANDNLPQQIMNQQQSTCVDSDDDERMPPEPRCYVNKKQRRGMSKTVVQLPNDPPLCQVMLTNFSEEAVETCLFLIDQVPDAVFKGTELLAILFRRNQDAWRIEMLTGIVNTLTDCVKYLRKLAEKVQQNSIKNKIFSNLKQTTSAGSSSSNANNSTNGDHTIDDDEQKLFFGEVAAQFNVRLHIFSLFLEGQYPDIRTPAVLALKDLKLIPELLGLLFEIERMLTERECKFDESPKWLAQMVLLIDLYEKVAIYTQRKNDMHKVTSRIWKWYDVASGKWNAYTVSNNKIINDAYWLGDSSVRVSAGRHRYTINFNCMSQVNEETGNHRPVILGLKSAVKRFPNHVSATLSYIFGESEAEDAEEPKTVSILTDS